MIGIEETGIVSDRAFPVSAARVWNGLPAHVTSSPSLHVFKRHLKTVKLFSSSFLAAASQ